MLITNWGDPTVFDDSTDFFEENTQSYALKLTAEWFGVSVYMFSLLAPLCFPGRDFS